MRPDTDVVIIVTDADGNTKTLDANASVPGDRPQGIQWATQQGSGFHTASFTLSCPIDADRDDIHLLDGVEILWADGDTAYEGFVAAMPRSLDADGQGTLTVTCAGWMASAADNPFTMVFVDRDMGRWGPSSTTRKVNLLTDDFAPQDASSSTAVSSGKAALRLEISGAWTTVLPIATAMYDAGPSNLVAAVYYDYDLSQSGGSWQFVLQVRDTDDQTGAINLDTGSLAASATDADTFTPTTPARWAEWWWYYNAAGGADGAQYVAQLRDIAVYGNHGLTLIGDDDPKGVAASDVIRWVIEQHCPLLNAAGVQDTTYPIAHLVFDTDTTPYDTMLKVNSYHQWLISVWENRTVHFAPYDLDDWDWEIRHDEVGNTIGLQGDEYTDLRNHIRVRFTNVATGAAELLTGDDYDQLRDDSIDNPLNQQGRDRSGEPFTIPYPTTRDNAVELGRLRLIEDNRPKAPGSFAAVHYLRDRAGILQPAGKARAGDRIRLTSSVNLSDRPRLIHETSYSDDGKSVTIAVDGTRRVIDAYMDRVTTSLAAAGLS